MFIKIKVTMLWIFDPFLGSVEIPVVHIENETSVNQTEVTEEVIIKTVVTVDQLPPIGKYEKKVVVFLLFVYCVSYFVLRKVQ